jgi:phosphohistidine swiveling domain-containing protein
MPSASRPSDSNSRLPNRVECGGKAAVLYALLAAGFRVPKFELAAADPCELSQSIQRLGLPLAVRSSASEEDGGLGSFAGQFKSFLNLTSFDEVQVAVEACRASVSSPDVVNYCNKLGVDPGELKMSVIIQRMIQPDLAGVAFTVNPTTGANEVVIEACEGLADGLLAGTHSALPEEHPLLQKFAAEITDTARRIQRHFGVPQDIEFAIADDVLYILQARPITRIGFDPEIGEWTNANFCDGGVSSSVCTPLMWSLYDFIWDRTLKECLQEIRLYDGDFVAGQMFFGRPYWNLGAVKRCVSKIPGFVEREFDDDLSIQINYEGSGRCTPVTFQTVLRVIPTVLSMPGFFRRQECEAERLRREFPLIEQRWESTTGDVAASFLQLIEQDYFRTENTYFRTIYAVSLAKQDLKHAFPDCDYISLVSALPDLQHMAPLRKMREMQSRGDCDIQPLIKQFRHHCRWGVDIRYPRWDEDAEFVRELAACLPAAAGSDPHPAYERARAAAVARLPWWRRPRFNRKLDRLRRLIWLREELRDISGRMYYLIRRHILEISKRRGLGDAIFFQKFREIAADDRNHIESRRDVYESFRNFKAPNEIGARFCHKTAHLTGAMTGIGASGGHATGVARVARSVQEALLAEAGSILICPFTEPGWASVLDRVAGVVTETGGQLSHAAVICREFGIPAVLGVANATERILDGSRVEIDGFSGTVTVVRG